MLTFADSLIFIKGLQFGYLWKIIWQIFMFSKKLYEEVNYFGKNLLKFFPYNTTYLFTGIFWGNCCILIHNIVNWLKIQKMVNPEIYFFFSFCKTIRANLQQYTTNVILFKLECIYYMYENANDVSLKNDIYVQLKFYKYMYTSIGI